MPHTQRRVRCRLASLWHQVNEYLDACNNFTLSLSPTSFRTCLMEAHAPPPPRPEGVLVLIPENPKSSCEAVLTHVSHVQEDLCLLPVNSYFEPDATSTSVPRLCAQICSEIDLPVRVTPISRLHVLSCLTRRPLPPPPARAVQCHPWGRPAKTRGLSNKHQLMCRGVGEGLIILRVINVLRVGLYNEIPDAY